ncbi:hypothetical protein C4K16_2898 [Pseudomonas chlororaphis subsp. aurantiaca]|nr:hypothetical protein C4K16_2898 [Pseudomonas chlororaphis subsp. aurantiaca]AZD79488.1 hypothetical protein C4K15_2921 [Pseudomonas chlororaphis subsp. aurantiaca]
MPCLTRRPLRRDAAQVDRSGYREHGACVAAAEQREAAIGNAVAVIRAARST